MTLACRRDLLWYCIVQAPYRQIHPCKKDLFDQRFRRQVGHSNLILSWAVRLPEKNFGSKFGVHCSYRSGKFPAHQLLGRFRD